MNYSIIQNEESLLGFINFLPELRENERFYLCLFARKKYCDFLKSDKSQLKRFCATKENMVEKIRHLECKIGSYKQDGVEIPQEALALYISVNPRDLVKASYNTIRELADLLQKKNCFNPHQEALSQIQKSCSRKLYSVFDIDCGDNYEILIDEIIDFFEDTLCCHFIRTRGGIHVLVEHDMISENKKNSWHKFLAEKSDVKGDCLIPVPGCTQGNFMPYFV